MFTELPEKMRQKLEVTAEVSVVVKIQQMLKTFVKPWEEENPELSFFEEMFIKMYSNPSKDEIKYLSDPLDLGKPSFQKSLKQIFRDLYDLSGQAKLKVTYDVIDNILENNMRVLIFGFHMTFLTALEDYLTRKDVDFLYLGKNISDEFRTNICDIFNREDKYRVIIIDIGEDLSNLQFALVNAVILFGELFWDANKVEQAEHVVEVPGLKTANNIIYLFGRYTLDEYIFKLLYRQN